MLFCLQAVSYNNSSNKQQGRDTDKLFPLPYKATYGVADVKDFILVFCQDNFEL